MFDDSNLWCDDCGNSNSGECNKHGTLHIVSDSPFVSRARQTLPSVLEFKASSDSKQGLSVFSRVCIQRRTRFGPLQAPPRKQKPSFSLLVVNLTHRPTLPFKIFSSNGSSQSGSKESVLWLNADATRNEELSNWMVFVAVARNAKEQNLVAFQYRAGIYFVTIKDIAIGEELRVWYAKEYAACMGIASLPNTDSTSSPSEGSPSSSSVAVAVDTAAPRGARRLRPRPAAGHTTAPASPAAGSAAAVCPVCRLRLPPASPGWTPPENAAVVVGSRRATRLRHSSRGRPTPASSASAEAQQPLCSCAPRSAVPAASATPRLPSLTPASARAPAASSRTPARQRTVGRAAVQSSPRPPTIATVSPQAVMDIPGKDSGTRPSSDDPSPSHAPVLPVTTTTTLTTSTSSEVPASTQSPRYLTRTSGPASESMAVGRRRPLRADPQPSTPTAETVEVFVGDWMLPGTSRQGMRTAPPSPRRPPKRPGATAHASEASVQLPPQAPLARSKKDVKNEENLQRAASATVTTIAATGGGAPSSHAEAAETTTPPPPPPQAPSPPHTPPPAVAGPSGLASGGSGRRGVRGTGEAGAGRHVCRVCAKAFGSPGKLSQHMYSHTGERPFECSQCSKAFSSKFKLVRHVLIHSDERRYRCTACERTFHRKDHLKNHVKVHSPVKKTFRCEREGCHKEYSSFLSFRKHAAVHAAEEGSLECKMCGKAFASKEEIVYHLKVHAGSRTVKNPSDKKYRCDQCERRFFTRKDVRRHLVVHTGKRDFLCQFCPQRFGRKDHLVRHIKKSHHHHHGATAHAVAAAVAAGGDTGLGTEAVLGDPEASLAPGPVATAARSKSKRARPPAGLDPPRVRPRTVRSSRDPPPPPRQATRADEYVLPHAPPEDSKAAVMVLAAAAAEADAADGPPPLKLADVEAVLQQQAPPPIPPTALKVEVLPVERSTITVHHHPRPQPAPPPTSSGPSAVTAAAVADQLYSLMYAHPPPPPYPSNPAGQSTSSSAFDPTGPADGGTPVKLELSPHPPPHPPPSSASESALEFSHLLGLIPVTCAGPSGSGASASAAAALAGEELSSTDESAVAAVAAVHEELQRLLSTAVGADEAAGAAGAAGEPHPLLVGDAGITSHILHLMQELQPVHPPPPPSHHSSMHAPPPPPSAQLLPSLLEPPQAEDPRGARRRQGQIPLPRFNQAFQQQTAAPPPSTAQQSQGQQQQQQQQPPPPLQQQQQPPPPQPPPT